MKNKLGITAALAATLVLGQAPAHAGYWTTAKRSSFHTSSTSGTLCLQSKALRPTGNNFQIRPVSSTPGRTSTYGPGSTVTFAGTFNGSKLTSKNGIKWLAIHGIGASTNPDNYYTWKTLSNGQVLLTRNNNTAPAGGKSILELDYLRHGEHHLSQVTIHLHN